MLSGHLFFGGAGQAVELQELHFFVWLVCCSCLVVRGCRFARLSFCLMCCYFCFCCLLKLILFCYAKDLVSVTIEKS